MYSLRRATLGDLISLEKVCAEIVLKDGKTVAWDSDYPGPLFKDDIKNNNLYLVCDQDNIAAFFVLLDFNLFDTNLIWEDENAKAILLTRFGVSVEYQKQGVGSIALRLALSEAEQRGATYLRLTTAEYNVPAINLYQKNNFKKVPGFYKNVISPNWTLIEVGFEKKI